jgi:hypothetical protein
MKTVAVLHNVGGTLMLITLSLAPPTGISCADSPSAIEESDLPERSAEVVERDSGPGTVVEKSLGRAGEATHEGLDRAGRATERRLERSAEPVGSGLDRAMEGTGRGLERAMNATGRGLRKAIEGTGRALRRAGEALSGTAEDQ